MKNHLHAGASAHAVVRGLFQQHCSNLSVPQCSLHQLLLGLLHCFAWAGSATLNIAQHVPTKELGVQVGTAAVFLAGDRLLKCHSGKRALASLQLASDILMKWLFPDSCNFGRSSTGALCALTGVLCGSRTLAVESPCPHQARATDWTFVDSTSASTFLANRVASQHYGRAIQGH